MAEAFPSEDAEAEVKQDVLEMDETACGETPTAAGKKKPTCLIVLGMAGSGKTTLVQRLTADLHARKTAPYVINLDPAVMNVPYPANIDIRDTVNYKEVMKQYSLGPNGGIITSLNLFATKFNQVINILETKANSEYVIIDTPGQIEVFTWSASGSIITESLASTFATVVVYVMDTSRSVNPVTFMSNMLYACSIMYKAKLPFLIVMNKTDIISNDFAVEWMRDFLVFQEALEHETSYMSSLTRSMSLVLDEFYKDLKCVGMSAMSGEGLEEFYQKVGEAAEEYEREYRPMYEELRAKREAEEQREKEMQETNLEENHKSSTSVLTKPDSISLHAAVGNEDDDSDDEEDNHRQPSDDDEARNEEQSFGRYLLEQRERQMRKMLKDRGKAAPSSGVSDSKK